MFACKALRSPAKTFSDPARYEHAGHAQSFKCCRFSSSWNLNPNSAVRCASSVLWNRILGMRSGYIQFIGSLLKLEGVQFLVITPPLFQANIIHLNHKMKNHELKLVPSDLEGLFSRMCHQFHFSSTLKKTCATSSISDGHSWAKRYSMVAECRISQS